MHQVYLVPRRLQSRQPIGPAAFHQAIAEHEEQAGVFGLGRVLAQHPIQVGLALGAHARDEPQQ